MCNIFNFTNINYVNIAIFSSDLCKFFVQKLHLSPHFGTKSKVIKGNRYEKKIQWRKKNFPTNPA